MRANSIAKAISAAIACVGLTVAVGGATLGAKSPYREVLIVAGIDGFVVGVAAFILIIIFFSETAPASPIRASPRMRSLDNPEGQELKKMLVRHVARDKPVTIGFPGDDPEAERFAAQIGQFLHENSFTVLDFAAAAPTVRLDPGIGIDDGNHILVGPIGSRASTAPSMNTSLPVASRPRRPEPAVPTQANGLNSP